MSAQAADELMVLHMGFSCGVDGPGQRLVIYLKGCNLCCPWCAAPESISPQPEVLFYPARVSAALAEKACPYHAVTVQASGASTRNVAICNECSNFACLRSGLSAFERAGEQYAVDDLVAKAERYRMFFGPDGGVTLGGGEPTYQFAGARRLLERLHAQGIHTAMETNGTHPDLPELFPKIKLLFIDLKHPDSRRCAQITGLGNEQVLANIRRRHAEGGAMVVRIPLVPQANADESTLHAFGSTLGEIGAVSVEVLPFHRRGEVKWRAIGQNMPAADTREPFAEDIVTATAILAGYGLKVI